MNKDLTFRRVRSAFAIAVTLQVAGLMFSIAISSIAFAVACVLFAVLAVLRPAEILRPTGYEWLILAYLLSMTIMVAFALYPASALDSSRRVLLLAVIYFIPAAFRDWPRLRVFLLVLAVISGVQSLLGIGFYFFADIDRLGVFQHYMTAAGIKMMIMLLLLPLLLFAETSRKDRGILAVTLAITLFSLLLTQTRSSWLGFGAGVMFLALLRFRFLFVGIAAALLLFLLLAPSHYLQRVSEMFSTGKERMEQIDDPRIAAVVQSNTTRIRMWETGWQMFLDHPLTGVGDGEMLLIYHEYVPDAIKDEGGHLHNNYVHLLASHGLIGFLAAMSLLVAIFWTELRQYRKFQESYAGMLTLGALAAFVGFAINGMAEYNFGDHEILVLLWTSVGVAVAASNLRSSEPAQ